MQFHWSLGVGHMYTDTVFNLANEGSCLEALHSKEQGHDLHIITSLNEHIVDSSVAESQLGNICASGSFADGENEKDGSWSDYDLDDVDVEALRSDLGLESDSETLRHAIYESGSESGDFDLYEF